MSVENEATSFVDQLVDGESHSPKGDEQNQVPKETDFIPEDEEIEFSDSVKEDPKENEKLQQEIEGLRKRLHDTQSAMHRATEEKSKLKKELEELNAKRDNEDDWFSTEDNDRVSELEGKIKETEAEITSCEEATKKTAEEQWDLMAAPVIKAHPDFEQVVYGEFVELLDEEKGDAQIKREFDALPDKSPAAIYNFAKAKLHKSGDGWGNPTGKQGLDMISSADMPRENFDNPGVSFVDRLFQ